MAPVAALRRRLHELSPRSAVELAAGALLGLFAMGLVMVGLSQRGPMVPAVGIAVIPVLAAVILKPRIGVLLLILSLGVMEEFRGGIGDTNVGGDEKLRSERMPFYAITLGLPSLYIPDVMVLGTLFLYLVQLVLWRAPVHLRFDKIGVGLVILAFAVLLSVLVSLGGPDPFGDKILDLRTIGSVTLHEKNVSDVARYFPVLQYKLFTLVFPSYLLGLFFFRDDRDVEQMLTLVGLAMVATVGLGITRMAMDPGMVRQLTPVIFDTGGVALLAMATFYVVGRATSNHYPPYKAIFYAILVTLMMAMILLSFRRTMWGAIALGTLIFPFILPRHALPRLLLITGVGIALAMLFAVSTPPGQAMLQSLVARAGETNLNQSSTLYRFAIMVWLVEHGADLPMFGFGLTPLWNERVYIRFFFTSMENVHSLYMWLLLRLGPAGFLAFILAMGLVVARTIGVLRRTEDEHYRILIGVILISVVMYLFNGIFNPVYANVRHLVPLGLSLALVTRMPSILARRREAAAGTAAAGG